MTREEKRAQCESFIKSKSFGLDTWMVIRQFEINAHNMLWTIRVYHESLKNLEKYELLKSLGHQNLLNIKQQIVLDISIKIVILIESTLALVDALSASHYIAVPEKMVYYSFETVYEYIKKIRNNKYNWRKVLGLPLPSRLPLSRAEQEYLFKDYEIRYAMVREALSKLAGFYDRFRIIYGKYKHGLTIQSGLISDLSSEEDELKKSILICYDRREKSRMPENYIRSIPFGERHNYFNATGILSFNQQLFFEIDSVCTDVRDVISNICQNPLVYAKNCGEGYLPYIVQDNICAIKFAPNSRSSDQDRIMRQEIAEKIAPLINHVEDELITKFNITREEIIESITKNAVTNIWSDTTPH